MMSSPLLTADKDFKFVLNNAPFFPWPSTGLPTKDETVKTTRSCSNMTKPRSDKVLCIKCGIYWFIKKKKYIVEGNKTI